MLFFKDSAKIWIEFPAKFGLCGFAQHSKKSQSIIDQEKRRPRCIEKTKGH